MAAARSLAHGTSLRPARAARTPPRRAPALCRAATGVPAPLTPPDAGELAALLAARRQAKQVEAGGVDGPPALPPSLPGAVYLVGTGPGDAGLLTLRAVQLMQAADVVLYDRLVSDEILQLVSPSARLVYVGKQAGLHTRSQEEIHELLAAFAQGAPTVLRLKGGDPFVFGRGGEEAEYLRAAGVAVHVVPGVTAAAGVCAGLGIPMTHRGLATSVRFLTGHARGGDDSELDDTVRGSADPRTTLVIYMGLATLPGLAERLVAAGLDPATPAAAVERGTTVGERVVYAPLANLAAAVGPAGAGLKSPTLVIIGQVVALAPGWADAVGVGVGVGERTGAGQRRAAAAA